MPVSTQVPRDSKPEALTLKLEPYGVNPNPLGVPEAFLGSNHICFSLFLVFFLFFVSLVCSLFLFFSVLLVLFLLGFWVSLSLRFLHGCLAVLRGCLAVLAQSFTLRGTSFDKPALVGFTIWVQQFVGFRVHGVLAALQTHTSTKLLPFTAP